ncbi:venom carboxylesterase-6 isoform X2 [Folsomia candida]|nr:venom carboxylesterase-6 isoform X2 [Folsomia candida]
MTSTKGPLPVMVWIYGGGFLAGNTRQYDPKYFMDQDVIVVSMNYRLGPLGFLNTGDATVTGNAGLKDQRLALKWVQDNIQAFGGDAKKVTIFGESAGAASVHAHIISPSSKNLFHKAILQSGSLYCPWSMNVHPARQVRKYGKRVGCPQSDMKALVACLKGLSAKQVTEPIVDFMDKGPFIEGDAFFGPTIESKDAIDPMFIENPRILIEQGKFAKVPVMMGVTKGEGGIRTSRLDAMNMDVETMQENWSKYAPIMLMYDPKRTNVTDRFREYYFSSPPYNHDTYFQNFTRMISDGWFFHALHGAVTHHNKVAPVYLYYYDYEAALPSIYSAMKAVESSDDWLFADARIAISIGKDLFKRYYGHPGPHDYGACHADELLQLFNMERAFEIGQKSRDYQFSKDLVKTFVDFAKSDDNLKFKGKEWPILKQGSIANQKGPLPFMSLNKDGGVINEPFFEIIPFWNSLNIRDFKAKVDW